MSLVAHESKTMTTLIGDLTMATKANKTIRINITLPLPEVQPDLRPKPVPPLPPFADHWPDEKPCSDCASCGTCGKGGSASPLLKHAGNILLNILSGKLTPEQTDGALDLVDQLLRRHYAKKQ
jgi:hypothetical protein